MRLLLWWATNFLALWVAARLVAGIRYDGAGFEVRDFFWAAILGALIVWAVNMALHALREGGHDWRWPSSGGSLR